MNVEQAARAVRDRRFAGSKEGRGRILTLLDAGRGVRDAGRADLAGLKMVAEVLIGEQTAAGSWNRAVVRVYGASASDSTAMVAVDRETAAAVRTTCRLSVPSLIRGTRS